MADLAITRSALAFAQSLARLLALFGGVVVLCMGIVTCLSVTGRALSGIGLGPITGDFELVELGCAVAVFSFLPWCQVTRAHMRVDLIGPLVPESLYRWLGWLGDLVLTAFLALLLWRLWLGFGERFPYGTAPVRELLGFGPPPFYTETTYELQLPMWIAYGISALGMALAVLVSVIMLFQSARPGARQTGAPL
ncbi:MAG: TRAP transporter small permease [Pseudomonadota bacterium]